MYNYCMNLKQSSVLLARISLFIIYFWFGVLKVIGLSPASPLVKALFEKTIPIMPFTSFIVLFGLFEMIIGILFFIPKFEKFAVTLFGIHMFTTVLPLFMVSGLWQKMFVPTLEGQYIIKNLALVVCALTIWVNVGEQKSRVNDTILVE